MDGNAARAIEYRDDGRPDTATIIALYRAAGLARPIDDPARIARMYAGANLILSAWDDGRLVGIMRAWTDDGFLSYIADLAVHPDYQRRGIGKELLERARATSPEVTFILNAAPEAADYYRHIGWTKIENGWLWRRER
jgi:GNAT superfamily N-acetyltransferase